jgi:hypothetical protein
MVFDKLYYFAVAATLALAVGLWVPAGAAGAFGSEPTAQQMQHPAVRSQILSPQIQPPEEEDEKEEVEETPRTPSRRTISPQPVPPAIRDRLIVDGLIPVQLTPQGRVRLEAVQRQINAGQLQLIGQRPRFEIAANPALNQPLSNLAGSRAPRNWRQQAASQNRLATYLLRIDREAADAHVRAARQPLTEARRFGVCNASARSFDWRDHGRVTPVRNQRNCGSCWAFTALGAYEGNEAIRNNQLINASEQRLVSCSGAGSCAGGWWHTAFDYMLPTGTSGSFDN